LVIARFIQVAAASRKNGGISKLKMIKPTSNDAMVGHDWTHAAMLIARLCMSAIFLLSGVGKLMAPVATIAEIESVGQLFRGVGAVDLLIDRPAAANSSVTTRGHPEKNENPQVLSFMRCDRGNR
jgi:hypothetical protein